jgi:ferredoxin
MNDYELNGPWRFRLMREVPYLAKGKTAAVADGVQFSDGACVLRWRGEHQSTAVYANFDSLMAIHGHEGATVAVFEDKPPTKPFRQGALDCIQDGCENCPFASIGGLDARKAPVPKFARPGEETEYLRGYTAAARANYGDDWETCTFSWGPALTIGATP